MYLKFRSTFLSFLCFLLFSVVPQRVGAQVVNIENKRMDNAKQGWQGVLNLDFDLEKNTTSILQLENQNQVMYQKKKNKVLLLNDIGLIQAGNQNYLNKGYIHIRYNYRLSHLVTWEAFVQAQYNQIEKQQLRALAGTGPRFRIADNDTFHFYLGTLYMYEYEELTGELQINRANRLSSYISIGYSINDHFWIDHITYYQPRLDYFGDFRIASETVFGFKIFKHLAFGVHFSLNYDTKPPPEVPDLIYSLKNSIGYKF